MHGLLCDPNAVSNRGRAPALHRQHKATGPAHRKLLVQRHFFNSHAYDQLGLDTLLTRKYLYDVTGW